MVLVLGAASLRPAPASAGQLPRTSIVAQAAGRSVAVFRARAARQPFLVLRNPTRDGSPLVFLVRRRVRGWAEVSLAMRPNGSLGWIRARSVVLAADAFHVEVSLRRHAITVLKQGRAVVRAQAAVGRASLPTPTGLFYITELLRQPNPRGEYGPYAFGLSGYSTVLFSFGGGPGQIGIHGTNEPSLLGTNASHGCIRVANAVIVRLAGILPLGTPVTIER